MLYALKDGIKISPTPKEIAICPFCKNDVIPKCGSVNIWHWAHKIREQITKQYSLF
jgi:competence protein CoiA